VSIKCCFQPIGYCPHGFSREANQAFLNKQVFSQIRGADGVLTAILLCQVILVRSPFVRARNNLQVVNCRPPSYTWDDLLGFKGVTSPRRLQNVISFGSLSHVYHRGLQKVECLFTVEEMSAHTYNMIFRARESEWMYSVFESILNSNCALSLIYRSR
jgi:hypothetical protein